MNTGRVLLSVFIAAFAVILIAHYSSPVLRAIEKADETYIVVLTDPVAYVQYNPLTEKAAVHFALINDENDTVETKLEHAKQVFNLNGSVKYLALDEEEWAPFWDKTKKYLHGWRNKPYYIINYINAYFSLYCGGYTNINPIEFYVLSVNLAKLSANDIELAPLPVPVKTKRGAKTAAQNIVSPIKTKLQPEAEHELKPLRIAIYNASGKHDLARKARRSLLKLNSGTAEIVDVFKFENYKNREAKTKIINYSGDMRQISKITEFIGMKTIEVYEGKPTVSKLVEAELILGEDFVLPK